MTELSDYSGELKPDLKYEDFPKEALIRLLQEYGRIFLASDAAAYITGQDYSIDGGLTI